MTGPTTSTCWCRMAAGDGWRAPTTTSAWSWWPRTVTSSLSAPRGADAVQVDEVEATDTGWRLVGWGADVTEKRTPDRFYVFAGDVLVFSGPPNVDNPNVVRWFDSDDLLGSGFDIEIDGRRCPRGSRPAPGRRRVRRSSGRRPGHSHSLRGSRL